MKKEEILIELKNKYYKVGFFRRVFSWRDIISNIETLILNIEEDNVELSSKLGALQKERDNLELLLDAKENEIERSEEKIKDMLPKLNDLHSIFKGSTGRKGKISELQVENVLSDLFGEDSKLWTKNLQVGANTVEFAFRSREDSDKWTPIDSKSIIPENDGEGNFIIDSTYSRRVNEEAKKISKYIGKKNTTYFALLVLPNDNVAKELNESFSDLRNECTKLNVYITSPGVIYQYFNIIDKLNNDLENVSKFKETLKSIDTLFGHADKFYSASKDGLDKMNIAFTTHLSNFDKKLEQAKNKTMIEMDKK
ncbi:MAG: DNA recombination protein RmuC [Mycoplasmataceae bacterium]|nr:DNA recombination protein RmuC [Mycoplasmataceae bacterium]